MSAIACVEKNAMFIVPTATPSLENTKEMIEKRLKHTIETTTQDEFVDLVGIFNSLKDKQSSVVDWFEQPKQKAELNILLDAEDDKESAN